MPEANGLEPTLLSRHRAILIGGPIDDETSAGVRGRLLDLGTEPEPIRVLIDSPGGDADEALLMYDFIRGLPVATIGTVIGRCWSAAMVVLQACSYRSTTPNATFLLHSVKTCAHGVRTEKDVRRSMLIRDRCEQRIIRILRDRTGLSAKHLRQLFREGDREHEPQFYPEQARKLRLIDRIDASLFVDPPK